MESMQECFSNSRVILMSRRNTFSNIYLSAGQLQFCQIWNGTPIVGAAVKKKEFLVDTHIVQSRGNGNLFECAIVDGFKIH